MLKTLFNSADVPRYILFAGVLSVCLLLGLSPAAAETVLVQFGSNMTYLDNQSDPGINMSWTDPEFDDSSWSTGQYGVGYESSSGAENLLLTTVPLLTTRSVYTRVAFNIVDAGAVQNLILGADYDDGYVAWINDVEVFRGNMTTGPLHWNSPTGGEHESSNGAVPFYELQDISAAGLPALRDGENILAVGVWNIGTGSSDLVLVPQLTIDKTLEITRGPYLQLGTDDSVTIRWRTNIATDSHVEYGSQPGSLNQSVDDPAFVTEHSVTLTGLPADTPYFYAVGTSTEILAGDDAEHHFRTNPIPGARRPFRAWLVGDTGYGSQNQADVRDAYLTYTGATPTDLWLHVGDVSQSTGTDAQYQTEFFDMYPGLLRKTVMWPTFGNHDSANSNSSSQSGPFYENFTLPTGGEAGGLASGTEAYYSFDYANVHFVVLNSTDIPRTTGSAMLTWLATDLANTAQDWIIAYWHHPPYSKGSHDSDSETELIEMRQYVVPILEDYGVDLAFSGHSHSYERTYLIDGHYGDSTTFGEIHKVDGGDGSETGDGAYQKPQIGPDPHMGTVYTVAGTGGQVYGGDLDHPAMHISLNVIGSVVLDINEGRLDAIYLDSTGSVLDRYTIIKGVDQDEDGISDDWDNCLGLYNPAQLNSDSDALGDACDNCPFYPNDNQTNTDADLLGDLCDPCPGDYYNDADWDGLCGNADNCPFTSNPGQGDLDSDGLGDACDIDDDDSDGVSNLSDCDPLAPSLTSLPGEIGLTVRMDKRFGPTLLWARALQGHTSNIYRGQVPAQQPFVNNAVCFQAEHADMKFHDSETLAPGELMFYLVTARNDCGDSSTGAGRAITPCSVVNDDSDSDGIPDLEDNCADVHDPTLADIDKDFVGDVCDNCPAVYNPAQIDSDHDGIGDPCDGSDTDSDGVPDSIDNCPLDPNSGQEDRDSDGDGDVCDSCTDIDLDGFGDPGFPANSCPLDNCPRIANPLQNDFDSDTLGDLCDACGADVNNDVDDDAVCADADNCPVITNAGQADIDSDDLGDVCDDCPIDPLNDIDSDSYCADADNCPTTTNAGQEDADTDGRGDVCDVCIFDPDDDIDSDSLCADVDNCPAITNAGQEDADTDGAGDLCDDCMYDADNDIDSDSLCGDVDNCPIIFNPVQEDADTDGAGDICDNCFGIPNPDQSDADRDGMGSACDNCPRTANPGQADGDSDGQGDVCDNCPVISNSGQEDEDAGQFGPQQVISTSADGARTVHAADLDGDGDTDIISASYSDSKVAWYENIDGEGSFGPQQVISSSALGAWTVFAADIDNDGDLDVLSASYYDDKIAWYENLDGAGNFGPLRVISTQADYARSVFAADLDGDGDIDVISGSYNDDKIAWYENLDGAGSFGSEQVISTLADGAESVFAADIDSDGDLDILSASYFDDKIAWYENSDGNGTFGAQQVISTAAGRARAVVAADVDGDGDVDVLSASYFDDKIAWYENRNGAGNFGPQQVISTVADGAYSLFATDLDGDDDIDVLSASHVDNKIAWYENSDGLGAFGPQQVITTSARSARSVVAAYVDSDNVIDAISASKYDDKIAWYRNGDGIGNACDNCPTISNAGQEDIDSDGDGDACDTCINDPLNDIDSDTICGDVDNCPSDPNTPQTDTDSDTLGDACDPCINDPLNDIDSDTICGDVDNCPDDPNTPQTDTDSDTLGDVCDSCINDPLNDIDSDTICGDLDNCPSDPNTPQTDTDSDNLGDVCDSCINDPLNDIDSDTICGDIDNCPTTPNTPQTDTDSDTLGDACDTCINDPLNDIDSDTICGDVDNCPTTPNPLQTDNDSDGAGNACDSCIDDPLDDVDSDTICGDVDNCPTTPNTPQTDTDSDNLGDACDTCINDPLNDVDSDTICGDVDNCPTDANTLQADTDSDSLGDACDTCINDPLNDIDSDTICGDIDNCPTTPNTPQTDNDSDGAGNACDSCINDPLDDIDSDTICGDLDNCPTTPNTPQADNDSDGAGNACDSCINDPLNDIDSDTICGDLDNCPTTPNTPQTDTDSDTLGDACDSCINDPLNDIDSDTVCGDVDNCPADANSSQTDSDIGDFGSENVIYDDARSANSVFAADIDGDGDNDILSASYSDSVVAWYENTDGDGTFGSQQVISTSALGAWAVFAADIDSDGDLDVLSASYYDDTIAWYENTDGNGTFGSQQVISTSADYARAVIAVDVDGDGDLDVVSGSYDDDKIAWYENTDGDGTFGSQQVISTLADGAESIFAADIDSDGDFDVLSASSLDSKVAWYENTDGDGTFGSQQVISTAGTNVRAVTAADIDGDGDIDVLSASYADDEIAWYENTDGDGTFGSQQLISTAANGAYSVFATDLDGDGDVDVLSASHVDNKIAWYENSDGAGTFGTQQVISTTATAARSVVAAHIDDDNLCDAISASKNDNTIAWYKNGDALGDACDNCDDVMNPGQEDADSDGIGDACDL